MTKHDPNLGRHPDVAGAKRSAGFSDTARMVERAINLKMTPHTASRNLDRRQEEPTYSTTSSNNPYAFPEQQDSALSAVLNPTESPSTSSSASAVQTSIAADGNSWSTTFSWTDSWSDSSSTGYSQPSNQALVEETTSSMTSSGSNSPTPSATTSGNNPITTLDAEDTSKMGTIYTIDVMVDTGSSQFWAAHDRCQECKQNGMTTINTYLPESCGQDASTTTIYYAMGWVKGCHVNTSITLGEDTLQNYPVLAVFEAGGGVEKLGEYYSGLIGLGTEGSDDDGVPTVVTALYQQGAIQQPIVGFYLPRAGDNQESEITFGDPATSEHADESKMVNLARQGGDSGHYIVRMDSFVIGSTTVAQAADCYLDTGSSGIAVPQGSLAQVFQSAFELNSTDPNKPVPCSAPASNTGVWITFGGQGFEIPYRDLVFQNDDGTCTPLISSYSGAVSDIWLFGDAFLHNVYHSVNVETGEVEMFGLKNSPA